MGKGLPKGISLPLYTLRQRFVTKSAFPVSSDATASMQDDFGRVLPQMLDFLIHPDSQHISPDSYPTST
jgi:hypothetical protein